MSEVAVPRAIQNKYHRDRLDLCEYDSDGTFKGYEIKRNLQDFHSEASWSWICNLNYFIMPNDLYNKVKDEIPSGIGVWVVYEDSKIMTCVKKPRRRELLCSKEDMMTMMIQGLSREYKKYRKLKEQEEKKATKTIKSSTKRTTKKKKN